MGQGAVEDIHCSGWVWSCLAANHLLIHDIHQKGRQKHCRHLPTYGTWQRDKPYNFNQHKQVAKIVFFVCVRTLESAHIFWSFTWGIACKHPTQGSRGYTGDCWIAHFEYINAIDWSWAILRLPGILVVFCTLHFSAPAQQRRRWNGHLRSAEWRHFWQCEWRFESSHAVGNTASNST